MKGLRKILRVSWTAKKTNEWVLNKAGVGLKRELLNTVKARKLAYYDHTMRKQRSCLEKEIMQGTMPGARRRGRPRTAWMDNIKTWTGLPMGESIRMIEDRDSTSMVWPTFAWRTAKEQNRTLTLTLRMRRTLCSPPQCCDGPVYSPSPLRKVASRPRRSLMPTNP